jgi:hypothetical protein
MNAIYLDNPLEKIILDRKKLKKLTLGLSFSAGFCPVDV